MSRNQSEVSECLKRTIVDGTARTLFQLRDIISASGFRVKLTGDVTKRLQPLRRWRGGLLRLRMTTMSVTHRVSTSHEDLTMKAKPRLQLCPRLVVSRRPKQLYMPESSLRAASPWHWMNRHISFSKIDLRSSYFASESLAFATAEGILVRYYPCTRAISNECLW